MDWLAILQTTMTFLPLGFAFLFGIGAGSFINVVVARMPYEKSVIWPSSHCFSCLTPIKPRHNVPLWGYLLLRGRCANCGSAFSSRYFWIELITGLAFVLIYAIDVLIPWFDMPGLRGAARMGFDWPLVARGWGLWAAHSALLALLLAASLIDAEHRIIPTTITYPGTLLGIACSVMMPWPWPSEPGQVKALTMPTAVEVIPGRPPIELPRDWTMPHFEDTITHGLQLWPAIGPPPSWAPAGSWRLGLLNSLLGAACGMAVGRGLKFLYESARGVEALGLGDADLLMMIGAFLGWQVAMLALPIGALASLVFAIPRGLSQWIAKKPIDPALPFGPGIAAGAGLTWLGWPRLDEAFRMTFDWQLTGIAIAIIALGMGACGLILRGRGKPDATP